MPFRAPKKLALPAVLIFLLGVSSGFYVLPEWWLHFPLLSVENKYALEAEYLYRFASEIPQSANPTAETNKEKKEPYLKWQNFGDAFRIAVLESNERLYQNVAYVFSYHGRIQGKRVEVEWFKDEASFLSSVRNTENLPPRWQLVFMGNIKPSLESLQNKNTLLVSVAPEPIELPNTPENYEKIAQVISGKQEYITDLYKDAPEDNAHIRFYNLKLAESSVPSPEYLIFKLNKTLLQQSGFEHIDPLTKLRNVVFKTAQDNLLLSKENIINVTGFSVQQKDSIRKQRNQAIDAKNEADRLRQIAEDTAQYALKQKAEADKQRAEAEKQTKIAKKNEQYALEQKAEADKQRAEAEKQKDIAEKQRRIAEDTAKYALKQKVIADSLKDEAFAQAKIAREQKKLADKKTEEARKALAQAKALTFSLVILGILTALLIGIFLYFRFRLIRKSKKETEALLLNTLPPAIVKELKDTGKTVMRKYERVSVIFTDFKGFSEITKNMTADEMIEELNDCFTNFDEIINKYGLERIKTIGDAYMCAGGLPEVNYHHPVTMTLAALEMQRFMKRRYEERDGNYWMCRLGLNVGAVRAGVVGTSKFAYDLWGNAVNIAARLESGGEVYKVNTNEGTYQLIKDFFDAEFRGEIKVKHGLVIPMYFINGLKSELSENGDGITPNARFQQKLKGFETENQEEVRRLEALDEL